MSGDAGAPGKKIKRKALDEILKDMDADAPQELILKFITIIMDIQKTLKMDQQTTDVVEIISKIEAQLHMLCDARNYLARRKDIKDKVTAFEKDLDEKAKKQRFSEIQKENDKKEIEAKQRQNERAQRMRDIVMFKGHPTVPRSQKKALKQKVVKKDTMDAQTKDEKHYLDPELFLKLQQVKKDSALQDEDEADAEAKPIESSKPQKPTLAATEKDARAKSPIDSRSPKNE